MEVRAMLAEYMMGPRSMQMMKLMVISKSGIIASLGYIGKTTTDPTVRRTNRTTCPVVIHSVYPVVLVSVTPGITTSLKSSVSVCNSRSLSESEFCVTVTIEVRLCLRRMMTSPFLTVNEGLKETLRNRSFQV